MNKRKIGSEKEELAARYLSSQGVFIKARNFNTRGGEIDIVGFHEGYLIFFEVKYRKNEEFDPAEAVDRVKRKRIIKAAEYFMYRYGFSVDTKVRFDVISVSGEDITWIKNAFDAF